MKRLYQFNILAVLTFAMLWLSSCVKQDFDKPPVKELPVGKVYTIKQLRQMYADSGAIQINYDASVYATVTMDESTGNIYKSAFVQDNEDAVNLHKTGAGGLRIGDSIRVYLKGVALSEYNGLFQLDNVDPDSNIVILATQKYKTPEELTLADIKTGKYESKLVTVTGVEFAQTELGKTWADAGSYGNRVLEDCDGNSVIVRTSSYATFAEEKLPEGKGDLTAVVSLYAKGSDTTWQLYIRTLKEVHLDGERCNGDGGGGGGDVLPSLNETFDEYEAYDEINKNGWSDIIVAGDRAWIGKVHQDDNNHYAQATGYNSGLDDMETWMITPLVDNTNGDKVLSFKSSMAYWAHTSGDPLEVYVSTDFTGDNFESATWTKLNPTLPTSSNSNYEWVESGDVDLSAYTGNVAIAFKYKGSDTESTSIAVDDVKIDTNGGGGGGEDVLPSLNETFDAYEAYDEINKNGWSDIIVAGDRAWIGKIYSDNHYAQATGYNSGLDDMETWMITPLVDNTNGDKVLSFKSSMAYWAHTSGDPLEVYVSTDFTGDNFESATWTKLNPTLPTSANDNYEWVESGDVDLSAYPGNIAVAFKYKGSDTESTSIAVDDVVIE